jgi:hypothetical protein
MHETPFFVWSNFPAAATREPITSPAHFVDLALEHADAPVSPYYALLQEVRQAVPAMDAGLRLGPDGKVLSEADLSPRALRLLHDYRLVQYDLAMGHRYSAAPMLESNPQPVDNRQLPEAHVRSVDPRCGVLLVRHVVGGWLLQLASAPMPPRRREGPR